VTQIGLHSMNLPYAAKRLQMSGEFGPANRHPYTVMAFSQSANHVTAEES
jgi:hypothetical protein